MDVLYIYRAQGKILGTFEVKKKTNKQKTRTHTHPHHTHTHTQTMKAVEAETLDTVTGVKFETLNTYFRNNTCRDHLLLHQTSLTLARFRKQQCCNWCWFLTGAISSGNHQTKLKKLEMLETRQHDDFLHSSGSQRFSIMK